MTTPIAEFHRVSKSYPSPFKRGCSVQALSDISFSIEPGEIFAILGPNRAGKTTLLKILLGLCQASSGHALRFGQPLSCRGSLARIGYMHENPAFPRYLTAKRLLEFYGVLTGLAAATLKTRSSQLLDAVGLSDRAHQPISRYSKGMIQRLALAQALLGDPELLLLDEPTEGLDLHARQLLWDTITRFRDTGKTVILVSHSLADVAQVCDRVAVLVQGRLAYLDSLDALVNGQSAGPSLSLESALEPIYLS
jgi:ABC-2 type transport system ATP-binding protein